MFCNLSHFFICFIESENISRRSNDDDNNNDDAKYIIMLVGGGGAESAMIGRLTRQWGATAVKCIHSTRGITYCVCATMIA